LSREQLPPCMRSYAQLHTHCHILDRTCHTEHPISSKATLFEQATLCSCMFLEQTCRHTCSQLITPSWSSPGWPHLRMAWPCHSCLKAGRPLSMLCMLLPRTHSPMGVWEHGSPLPGTCSAAHCHVTLLSYSKHGHATYSTTSHCILQSVSSVVIE
jgi:hypothetical protein